ncbi:hypothetical protein BGK67_35020 (plasmid) [Streptomyces subrutilus]|uniref:Uncharacterized protein n=1 Tax=Streptomyces subrutilus TaxID=36818 RepID=A0A1E5NY20_9ACTN|nr:hypothetical protein BGK67_35020 [Streptomyces subrutilus]
MIEIQPTGLAADLEALAGAPAAPKGPPCTVGAFLAHADEPTAAALRVALDTPSITGKSIADTLRKYGGAVTAYTVARHRRRGESNGCRCPR